jgi:slime mold repeat-containing protein
MTEKSVAGGLPMRSFPSWHLSHLALLVALLLLFAPAVSALPPQSPTLEVACPDCVDFNFCTIDSCDTSTGTCRHDPRDCDDHNPCTIDSCPFIAGPESGNCSHANLSAGTMCSDGNSCTQADSCQIVTGAGIQCVGTTQPAGTTCDDANSCTTSDTCSEGGLCEGALSAPGVPCDDGSECTSSDICVPSAGGAPLCQGTAKNCEDGNPCSQDLCDPATGECGNPPVNCNDGNSCTADSCDPSTGGCLRSYLSGSCNDGHLCTINDFCSGGNCLGGGPNPCDDHVFCTHDSCIENDPAQGLCLHSPDNSLCRPANGCGSYVCQISGPAPDGCSFIPGSGPFECDGNPCTNEICDVRGNCLGPITNNTGPCDDHDPCTNNDQCVPGPFFFNRCVGTHFCDDGNVCTQDVCSPMTAACTNQPLSTPTTCGVGGCQRTVDTCAGGVFQPCVPGTPTPEICNGIDDNCDGLGDDNPEVCNGIDDNCNGRVDEFRVQAECTPSPSTLNLNSQGGIFSLTCRLSDVCDINNPVSISGATVSQVYVSLVAGDILPDPATLPCPDPVLGSLYERGISENLAARDVSHANVTFKFNLPADGDCATLDGDRQDLAAKLTSVPDNTNETVCISGKVDGADFETCVSVLVRNKGPR